ncbi:MAG: chlorophyll synthase ChlG [Pseudomonadota bacterium]
MARPSATALVHERPAWTAYVELLKPITWFPPMWAFGCGVVASGQPLAANWAAALAGIALAGPLVCGTSQVVNDWFDRDVDRINEPDRPIPSGRVGVSPALWFAIGWSLLSFAVSLTLGPWVAGATIVGLALAWAYSAPPFRLKQNGWWGNSAVGLCYEGLPWFTAAAAMAGTLPARETIILALLYSIGAHGIMTLNDFKSIEGDRIMKLRSLPVQLGADGAARLACLVMALPQVVVVVLLAGWGEPLFAAIVGAVLGAQIILMSRFLRDPTRYAVWYSGFGVLLYVLGMLASAFAACSVLLT